MVVGHKQLDDICLLIADCPHSTPKWTSSGVIVLRNQNIKNGRLDLSNPSFTDEKNYLERTRRAVPTADDIVITREAPMGDVCLIPKGLKCCLGQRQVLIRPNPALVNPQFLLYAFQSDYVQNQIRWNEGTGSTVSNLRIPELKKLKVPIFDLSIQKRIARTLGALDEKIALNRRMNATLEAMARALFKAWFVDFEPVHANLENRPSTSASPEIAKLFPSDFENGIPKGWEFRKLGDALVIAYGKNLPTKQLKDSGFPVFGGNGIIGHHHSYLYEKPQVLVACRGAASGKINQSLPRSFVTNNSLILQTDQETELGFNYLKHFMLGVDATAFVTGSAQPQVTIENLKHLQTLVPNKDALNRFEAFGSSIEDLIFKNQEQNASLAEIRDSLLPRLISGKIQVGEESALYA